MSHRIPNTTIALVLLNGAWFDSTIPAWDDPSTSESGSSSVGVSTSTTGTADTSDATTGDTPFPDESSGITGLESSETTESSSTDESSSEESTTGEPAQCDATAPFGDPVLFESVNTEANEYHISFSSDELVIYLSSNREGSAGADLYTGVRVDRNEPFGTLTSMSAVNTEGNEFSAIVTEDKLTLYVDSNAPGVSTGGRDIMAVARNSPVVDFGPIAPVSIINTPSNDVAPYVSADGTVLYFATNAPGSLDIYRTVLLGNGTFAPPTPVEELDSAANDSLPVVSADGLSVIFQSQREGGVGRWDLWIATRSTPDEAFGALSNLEEVNSELDDFPTWLSPDGCRLYFSSTRPGVGGRDIWIAERQ